jgi:transcriptional regulator GlxA family with amidase domain
VIVAMPRVRTNSKVASSGKAPAIKRIVIPVYPDFDILDVSGPFAMFSTVAKIAGVTPVLATAEPGMVTCLQGIQFNVALKLPALTSSDAIWVPGGFGKGYFNQFSSSGALVEWLKTQGPKAAYVCSVCTGALLAAAGGLLAGYTVTTHWQFQQSLALFPGVRLASGFPRYWIDRNRITGGGVSSGLDESLAVIAILSNSTTAMYAQLLNQYAPNPPFHAGTPLTASPEVLGSFEQIFGGGATELETVVAAFLKSEVPRRRRSQL